MKALIQRVKKASVTIDNELFSSINEGLLVFLGVGFCALKYKSDKDATRFYKQGMSFYKQENRCMIALHLFLFRISNFKF